MKKAIYIVLLLATLCGCQRPELKLTVRECAPIPVGRASACACVCEGKAYVFGGRDAGKTYLNDLWQYDPTTDTWTDLGAAPMKARVKAAMACCEDKIYVGLGYSVKKAYRDSAYQQDWYEYTPATASWKQLKDFPSASTVDAHCFALNGKIYVLYGFGYSFTRDIWAYNIAEDTWTLAADDWHRAQRNFGGCGAYLNGLYYYGTGYDTHNLTQWFAADIENNRWTECTSVPGKGRQLSACAASNDCVYLFGGRYFAGDMTGGEIFDSYLRYVPDKNQWEWCGSMPCGRAENQIAFSIDGKVYFGLGEDDNGQTINKLYRLAE